MALFIIAVIIFILADILIRFVIKKFQEKKINEERSAILDTSLKIDYSTELKSFKHAEVPNPKAKILCVDDESVVLDSFRKILVLDGYSIDTVENGAEVVNLIQTHNYDFVFSDLKMPEMDGVEVTKAVKHLRPDIDVVIITGYATVDTAVETMKFGAMDYVEKPFTEEELLEFVKKILIKREDRISKQLKPRVYISHLTEGGFSKKGEFSIPGGVFISEGHCWAGVDQEGTVRIGMDDFAKKLIGRIDKIDFPQVGIKISKGQQIFSVAQGSRSVSFTSPVSGNVTKVNNELIDNIKSIDISPYNSNWICIIAADNLDNELRELKIGKSAVSFYEKDIELCKEEMKKIMKSESQKPFEDELYCGELENLDDQNWDKIVTEFFNR